MRLNVMSEGAAGTGASETDDSAVINDCIARVAEVGGSVVFPDQTYRVKAPLRVGASILTGYEFLTGRTDVVSDDVESANTNYASVAANNENLSNVSLLGQDRATIIADFLPSTPTPVIEYNLSRSRGDAVISGLRILSANTVVNPAYEYEQLPFTPNNLIGLAILQGSGVSRVSDCMFGGLSTGLLGFSNFWCKLDTLRFDVCGDAINYAGANVVQALNLFFWGCERGLIVDGGAAAWRGIGFESVGQEIIFFNGVAFEFSDIYQEDVATTAGTGYVCSVGVAPGVHSANCLSLTNMRVGGCRPGKKTFRFYGSAQTRITSIDSSAPAETDDNSYGSLRSTNMTGLALPNWVPIGS